MKGHSVVAEQLHCICIPKETATQLGEHPTLRELRFVKIKNEQWLYDVYALQEGIQIPHLAGFGFVDAGQAGELEGMLQRVVITNDPPQEMRVIRPYQREVWGIFLKSY